MRVSVKCRKHTLNHPMNSFVPKAKLNALTFNFTSNSV